MGTISFCPAPLRGLRRPRTHEEAVVLKLVDQAEQAPSLRLSQGRELENEAGEFVILAVKIRGRHAHHRGQTRQRLQIRRVLASLVLVDSRTGGKLIYSRFDAKLLLG